MDVKRGTFDLIAISMKSLFNHIFKFITKLMHLITYYAPLWYCFAALLLQHIVEIHITTGISMTFTLLLANITTLMGITIGFQIGQITVKVSKKQFTPANQVLVASVLNHTFITLLQHDIGVQIYSPAISVCTASCSPTLLQIQVIDNTFPSFAVVRSE